MSFQGTVPEMMQPTRNDNIRPLNALFAREVPDHGGRFVWLPAFPTNLRAPDGIHVISKRHLDLSAFISRGWPELRRSGRGGAYECGAGQNPSRSNRRDVAVGTPKSNR
jgi:hypothetical protein